jgi:hypothetical protein
LENQLAKCVNWAKYYQQRGFDNETQELAVANPTKQAAKVFESYFGKGVNFTSIEAHRLVLC